jgi:hypothetical protein
MPTAHGRRASPSRSQWAELTDGPPSLGRRSLASINERVAPGIGSEDVRPTEMGWGPHVTDEV